MKTRIMITSILLLRKVICCHTCLLCKLQYAAAWKLAVKTGYYACIYHVPSPMAGKLCWKCTQTSLNGQYDVKTC